MTLEEIYNFIKFIGDKDYNGNYFRPAQFNSALQGANIDLYHQASGLPAEYQPGSPIARQHFEINQKSLDEVRNFKGHVYDQALTSGKFTLPAAYVYHDSVSYKYQRNVDGTPTTLYRPVEILTENQLAARLGSWRKQPTTKNPVAVYRSSELQVYPATISAVDFHYYRMPVQPVFAYTIVNDDLVYDSGSSTEVEWPEVRHMDLIRIMLSYLGINLSHEMLVQYAEMQKQKGV